MRTVLMVAEKPSLAQSIARILSKENCTSRKGLNASCFVHEFTGIFQGQTVRFKMTSVCGHVMSLDFIAKYNNWDKVDPAELFSKAPTEKKEVNPKLNMVKFLQVEARGCDYLVLWLDCDKEGENICFEVLEAVQPVMKGVVREQTVYRAKFSSITDTDIWKAMNHLGEPNHNEALAVDARQELDLRIGCAFTRFQTKYFQGKYGNLDSSLISFGPCQTPTLGFCVERHDKIQSFKPENYWVINAKVFKGKDNPLILDWNRVKVFDKEVGQMFVNLVKTSKEAQVESVIKKEKTKPRPLALNTVEMLRVASSSLGMAPQYTMQIAERLYTQGYISYPRTETTHYPENFDLKGTLKQQINSRFWGEEVKNLLSNGINHPKKGVDVGDHPPITPMHTASEVELGSDGWRLYEYITRHFIATVSQDCKYLQTTIAFNIGTEAFTCSGKTLISSGYTALMPWQGISLEEDLPVCESGDIFTVDEIKLVEKQTTPPDYLTEAELITLMEKHGIGTDASIPVHINNVCQRNYVTVENGRKLKPTNLGIVLVHGYYKIDAELVLPTIRSAVEKQLNLIALGKAHFQEVLQHALDIFKRKFHYFVDSICGMDELMEVSFSPIADAGKPMSRCGKCRRFMKFIQVAQENCNACDALLVTVDFNKARTPLPASETQHTGCVFCDSVFQDLVALKHATMRHPMHRGGGARRGQGRGRGRRGPPKKPKDKMAELAAYFV
ncbi:DNA topoisomerase 3-beta-1 isoform X2 [Phyllopteryx taeniolatus]|uniref:DNA topoisomerase 3-beta-1 isoform X2 n=1 Tax=Phyllopteryx taeniolatus TaxID=161469 RepID=UPI002AD54930|nr:DNA topoisomerase 3-beta-1 isoform X2 [Phyllopteryx taeniolatus]